MRGTETRGKTQDTVLVAAVEDTETRTGNGAFLCAGN